MGYQQNSSNQSSWSQSSTYETALSKEQAAILKQREEQYQQYFFPELVKNLQEVSKETALTPTLQSNVQAVNQQAGSAKVQFTQDMAKRGLSGSGTETQGLAALSNSKSNLLANAYYQAQQANQAQKNNALQLALAASPTPTTAAPLGQTTQSSGSGSGFGLHVGL
ncbi:hypothetical protein [Victivallis vadensis]|uniref:hypothetical protein n=1 Tax=Victivallis vadensis TaxID=172901 RepID=UPI0023F648CC|nr:hypothetical protein [Victivallis vadensis]